MTFKSFTCGKMSLGGGPLTWARPDDQEEGDKYKCGVNQERSCGVKTGRLRLGPREAGCPGRLAWQPPSYWSPYGLGFRLLGSPLPLPGARKTRSQLVRALTVTQAGGHRRDPPSPAEVAGSEPQPPADPWPSRGAEKMFPENGMKRRSW